MPPSTPLFHAELLLNIKSITVSINLPSPSNSSTKLTLSKPSQLDFQHDGETTHFNLPACVAVSASLPPRITAGETRLSYRLPVAPESQPISAAVENYVPWSAISLSSFGRKVSLHCQTCSMELVNGEKVSTWKDLPSGNWADMMDFWHCHKPETDEVGGPGEGSKYSGLQRGYRTITGTVLVELTYFLVAEGDCVCVKAEVINPSYSYSPPPYLLGYNPVCTRTGQKEGQQPTGRCLMAICIDTTARNQLSYSVTRYSRL